MFRRVDQAAPGGCVIGVLAFIPFGFSLLLGLHFYKLIVKESDAVADYLKYGLGALGCVVLGVLMIRVGWRLALAADMSDRYSDTKPRMRW